MGIFKRKKYFINDQMISASVPYALAEFKDLSYSIDEWRRDIVRRVSNIRDRVCPKCLYTGLATCGDIKTRKYRGCHACGFWQELCGPVYQCNLIGHICYTGELKVQYILPWESKKICEKCDQEYKNILTYYDQLK